MKQVNISQVADHILQQAIMLKCSNYYDGLAIANMRGGTPSLTDRWTVARTYNLVDLITEAIIHRKLDMTGWKTAVDEMLVCESKPYVEALGQALGQR